MKYSQSTELAIDSMFYMAAHPESTDFSVEQVAQAQHVSVSYLAKIFQQLVKAGLLRSHRGSKGGYSLGRAPKQITLRDVAIVFEGSSPLYECNANSKLCHAGPKCLILATFSEAERRMHEVLERVSLQDIVNHSARDAAWIKPASGEPSQTVSEVSDVAVTPALNVQK
ncbi:MAG TPA: Rrf2 family transcriptional regulator [Planctomycetota bacterium]|nr:Rrf2 family transcriptional regulator [Planctomycetota bacterium]